MILTCLQSGLSSSKEKDKVNCEDVETIGANRQTNRQNRQNISFRRSNRFITLVLQKSVKCKDEVVHFVILRLLSRLISIAEWTHFKSILDMNTSAYIIFKGGRVT